MIELLDKFGFKGEYNMVYLPMDRFRKKAKGFAFVNFEYNEGAKRCMSVFEGFQNWGTQSRKVCTVEWGERQGSLHSQVLAYGNGAILRADMSQEFKPALFHHGVQVSYSASLF
jgi:RNA recognition motif-containing protein